MFLCVCCIYIKMFLCVCCSSLLVRLVVCVFSIVFAFVFEPSLHFFLMCLLQSTGWGFKTAESDTGTGYPRVKFCWVGFQVKTQQSRKPIVCQKRYPGVKLSWVGIVLKEILFKSCKIASWFWIFRISYWLTKIDLMNRIWWFPVIH